MEWGGKEGGSTKNSFRPEWVDGNHRGGSGGRMQRENAHEGEKGGEEGGNWGEEKAPNELRQGGRKNTPKGARGG